MRILIVEDDPVSHQLLSRTLVRLGYDVTGATDGQEAWELFPSLRPRLVITDWMMPRVDGLELCRRVRADRRFSRGTYLMVLTALTGRSRYLEGMDAGADDFLTKPFDPEELTARLRVAERILALESDLSRLETLLPVCAECHAVRNGDDDWVPLARYVAAPGAGTPGRGCCPDCRAALEGPRCADGM